MLISSRARNSVIRSLADPVSDVPATMSSRQAWKSAATASGTSSQLEQDQHGAAGQGDERG